MDTLHVGTFSVDVKTVSTISCIYDIYLYAESVKLNVLVGVHLRVLNINPVGS